MGWKTKALCSVPGKDKNFLLQNPHTYPPSSPSLLFIGLRALFSPGEKRLVPEVVDLPHLVSGIRMNGAIPLLPSICLHIQYSNTFTYVMKILERRLFVDKVDGT
jgi:hypothetical protein